MRYEALLSGKKIPVIGLGTWGFGGTYQRDKSHKKEDIAILKTAIEIGYTHIDTAELYGGGLTEEEVGMALKEVSRENMFITSKVWTTHLKHDDVIKAAKRSLKRLGTKYLDLYFIHWPNPKVPLKETMKAMERLVDEGKVRSIGVSNFSLNSIQESQDCLTKYDLGAVQSEFNLHSRGVAKDIMPYCKKNGIIFIAYRPLARGKLAMGKEDIVGELAKKYGKSAAQIALSWVISHPKTIAVTKASSESHLKDNLESCGLKLAKKDKELLNKMD